MIEELGFSIIWLYQNLWGRMQRPYILGGGYRFLRFTFCRLPQRASRLFVRKNCKDLEASAPDRTITRNATPLPPSSRAVDCEWPSERTTADRPFGWWLPFFTFHLLSAAATRSATSPPYGWWSPSFHLSPFTFHRVPTWVA